MQKQAQAAVKTNTQYVQEAYANFNKGDIPALLDELTDDVKWTVQGPANLLPWLGTRNGKKEVGEFFKLVNENIEFQKFEPKEYIAQGDKVVTMGHWEARSKKTGKAASSDWVMVTTVRNGKICEHREFADTYEAVQTFKA